MTLKQKVLKATVCKIKGCQPKTILTEVIHRAEDGTTEKLLHRECERCGTDFEPVNVEVIEHEQRII